MALLAVLQPRAARCHARGLGSGAFARRYSRYHWFVFSSSGYLDVSVPRVRLRLQADAGIAPGGLPHSETRASTGICPSARNIAACRVLLRLREPRHPSRALLSFPFIFFSRAGLGRRSRSLLVSRFEIVRLPPRLRIPASRSFPLFRSSMSMCSLFRVENNGFEPLTPCLQNRCSSQLS